jgi:hypothetical protein
MLIDNKICLSQILCVSLWYENNLTYEPHPWLPCLIVSTNHWCIPNDP